MRVSEQQKSELLEIAKPLMGWLKENCHPHCTVLLDSESVELLEGICRAKKETTP